MTIVIIKTVVMPYVAFYIVCLKSLSGKKSSLGDAYRNSSNENYYEVDGRRERCEEAGTACFRETYLADAQKANLCRRVAQKEKVLLESRPFEKEYSLYIGIPFCPTTCLYCSFTSFPVARFGDRMDAYLDALNKELAFVAEHHRDKKLTTIYIGLEEHMTALNEKALSRLMYMIHELFPVEENRRIYGRIWETRQYYKREVLHFKRSRSNKDFYQSTDNASGNT